jgi:hypothetical protein
LFLLRAEPSEKKEKDVMFGSNTARAFGGWLCQYLEKSIKCKWFYNGVREE